MLALSGSEQSFAGIVLLDCAPLQAECIALFAASSTENRLKHFDGYRGAAFLASVCGRFALELVLWENAAALATVQKNPLFSEHIKIVEHHVKTHYVAFGTRHEICGRSGISFTRGERFLCALYTPCTPASLAGAREQIRSMAEVETAGVLIQHTENGASFVLLSKEAFDAPAAAALSATCGEPSFQGDFMVVESIPAPSDAERFPPPYRLALSAA